SSRPVSSWNWRPGMRRAARGLMTCLSRARSPIYSGVRKHCRRPSGSRKSSVRCNLRYASFVPANGDTSPPTAAWRRADMGTATKKLRYALDIQALVNGRIGRATVLALDMDGRTLDTDKADLVDARERQKLATRMAGRLNCDPKRFLNK